MAKLLLLLLLLLLAVAIGNWQLAEAKGNLHLQLIRYVNFAGRDSSGNSCDPVGPCDPYFTLKLDTTTAGGENLLARRSPTYHDTNSVTFGSVFGSGSNPIRVQLGSEYPGYVMLMVHVMDEDVWFDDEIGTFTAKLITTSSSSATSQTLNSNGNTLSIKFWFECQQNYFGSLCNTYCRPHNDDVNGHYQCDTNGNKICLTGWVKAHSDCKELHPCSTNPCKNGGTCVQDGERHRCLCAADYAGSSCEQYQDPCQYRNPCVNGGSCFLDASKQPDCRCSPQFRGPFCQYDVDECQLSPCSNNQTCVNSFGGFSCSCSRHFTGRLCEFDVNECNSTELLCKNGGTCVNVHGNFSCRCPTEWTGRLCELDVDECSLDPCYHDGGVCVNTRGSFECNCSSEFTGRLCELHKCNGTLCHNGGSCEVTEEGQPGCNCTAGFNGSSCELNVDDCASAPCRNGAECVDGVDDFECRCRPGFLGRSCEVAVYVLIPLLLIAGAGAVAGFLLLWKKCRRATEWNRPIRLHELSSSSCLPGEGTSESSISMPMQQHPMPSSATVAGSRAQQRNTNRSRSHQD